MIIDDASAAFKRLRDASTMKIFIAPNGRDLSSGSRRRPIVYGLQDAAQAWKERDARDGGDPGAESRR
jgi:hypothetical protein